MPGGHYKSRMHKIVLSRNFRTRLQRENQHSLDRPGHVNVKLDEKRWISATAREFDETENENVYPGRPASLLC